MGRGAACTAAALRALVAALAFGAGGAAGDDSPTGAGSGGGFASEITEDMRRYARLHPRSTGPPPCPHGGSCGHSGTGSAQELDGAQGEARQRASTSAAPAGQAAARTTPPQKFDCDAGFPKWETGWSEEKKEWCCVNKQTPTCPEPNSKHQAAQVADQDDAHPSVPALVFDTFVHIPWREIVCAMLLAVVLTPFCGTAAIVIALRNEVKRRQQAGPAAAGPLDERQMVASPYSGFPEDGPNMTSLVLQLLRLARICVPTIFSKQGGFLAKTISLAMADGLLECLVPSMLVRPLWTMVKNDQMEEFQAFACFMMVYNLLISLTKAAANYYAMRAMISCRKELVHHLHSLYMSRHGRNYYTLGNLDNRVDTPGARITNDVDLMMQFLFEFVFGGIMKPEAGMCSMLFFLLPTLGVAHFETEQKAPGKGLMAITVSLLIVAVSLIPTVMTSKNLTAAQAKVQSCEANLRAAHAKCRLFAESVCFYAGEATEAKQLDAHFVQVKSAFKQFSNAKFFVELIQLSLYFGVAPIGTIIAAFIVRQGEWTDMSETTFYVVNLTFVRILRCCMEISKNMVDLAKAQAMLLRVIQILEVMDAFHIFDLRETGGLMGRHLFRGVHGCLVDAEEELCFIQYYHVRPLYGGEVVPVYMSDGIGFRHVDVYTPDGRRLLLQNVSLRLAPGESCLIMGPSGIGKSSLLRVLGQLWPLFRTPGPSGAESSFWRPGPLNVFFLAQRPYLFEGTLREQLAYPVWDPALLRDLDDDRMERLFKEANLGDVWEARKDELDAQGISWEDVLSLGEQQRLQFCRLFWHAEWHQRHMGGPQGFFAVLDESSASMDTNSEMAVYQACRSRGIGYLSVAHRPTVIQFHSKVLHFEFDARHQLEHRVRDAHEMALESARQIASEGTNNTELRPSNIRRSISSSSSVSNLADARNRSVPNLMGFDMGGADGFDASPSSSPAARIGDIRRAGFGAPMVTRTTSKGMLSRHHLTKSMSSVALTRPMSRPSLAEEQDNLQDWKNALEDQEDNDGWTSQSDLMDEPRDPDALVLSPYLGKPLSNPRHSSLQCFWRLVRICHREHALLAIIVALNFLCATMLALWSVVFMNLKSIMEPGATTRFKIFGQETNITVSYEMLLPLIFIWGPLQGVIKTVANFLTVRLMIEWRSNLQAKLQEMYLCRNGRLYYTLSNLDGRVDSADQRITNDVDLLMQFFCEFAFGGVMKTDSGVLFKSSVFVVSCLIVWLDVEQMSPGQGGLAPGLAFSLFAVGMYLVDRLGQRCGEAQAELQASEGAFRAAHSRVQTFAEGISFYGGEETERVMLDTHLQPVLDNFIVFARRKFPMEVLQLLFFQGQYTIAMLLGGVVAFKEHDDEARRTQAFDLTNSAMVSCLQALNKITCQAMDFAKARALCLRVSMLYEVMEAFLEYDFHAPGSLGRARSGSTAEDQGHVMEARPWGRLGRCLASIESRWGAGWCGVWRRLGRCLATAESGWGWVESRWSACCSYEVLRLPCGALVPAEVSQGVVFQHVDVYTPDGLRKLLENVSLRLEPKDRCLIMGPSGIGKSSLLRILGQLWPLFRTPGAHYRAKFSRPGPRNVFFLAQRPYLFDGTLREQVAYPEWTDTMLDELTDDIMERLFREANLSDAWEAHRGKLDDDGMMWADVLSLGEQQRLQFCRLFYHHEWVRKHGDSNHGFFAILDESSASMDTTSEETVYRACCTRQMGILSVAHRPTVIQFHTKVLHWEFDEQHELRYRVRPAASMAQETAALLIKHLRADPGGGAVTVVQEALEEDSDEDDQEEVLLQAQPQGPFRPPRRKSSDLSPPRRPSDLGLLSARGSEGASSRTGASSDLASLGAAPAAAPLQRRSRSPHGGSLQLSPAAPAGWPSPDASPEAADGLLSPPRQPGELLSIAFDPL